MAVEEPFWVFEKRKAVERLFIGRKRLLYSIVGLIVVLLVLGVTAYEGSILSSYHEMGYSTSGSSSTTTLVSEGADCDKEKIKEELRAEVEADIRSELQQKIASIKGEQPGSKPGKSPKADKPAKKVKKPAPAPAPEPAPAPAPAEESEAEEASAEEDVRSTSAPADVQEEVQAGDEGEVDAQGEGEDEGPATEAPAVSLDLVAQDVPYKKPKHSRRTSDMFMLAASECPGRPSKKGAGSAPVPKASLAPIQQMLDLITEGVKEQPTKANGTKLVDISCIFLTQECADSMEKPVGRWMARKLNLKTEEEVKQTAARLPLVGHGGLGSCAIVGNSDNMIGAGRGKEIDAHDTIFRHNTPVKGFEKDVGSRSTIIYMKSKYTKAGVKGSTGKSLPPTELAYAELKDVAEVPRSLKEGGKHIWLRTGNSNSIARDRRSMYRVAKFPGAKHPSGGWARPLNLLASKLCTRIDIYGFSGNAGGKYFAKAEKVRPAHKMGFEHWTFRYLQAKGKLCVYGD